ncbi:HAD family hydrolase [Myceligenerans pegani]|uniref:HAD-IA family hydrolase n=1 Tax=Myceligenerans pegani TaxID=2776917 RepID=A0ABR9N3M8_9MICO|nr:HAD-IA family hydrolase [Myceligenerans sp. TRM 65318]MBE1878263.1 HAD-IA family hydrolase [Myceligenerans sp. TRM 65318]MBE3020534.1 HAD-IA family hydrolase [Myceligenerans sp. TRM 65318]
MPLPRATLDLEAVDAVVLDTDGVITDTARVHAAAWKRVFDALLRERGRQPPFDAGSDYLTYVDGRSRADGARGFLRSRDLELPDEELASLLDRKTRHFLDEVAARGVRAFPDAVAFLHELRRRGTGVAAVSASRNCGPVLRAAGVDGLADVRVDGVDAARLGLAGKPDPALFLEAARRLAVRPGRCALVEDALAGVEAGRRGGFGRVIGVDRTGGRGDEMRERGAHVVVGDLGGLAVVGRDDGARDPVV